MRTLPVILVALVLLCNTIPAATVEPSGIVPPYTLIRVRLAEGERAWILSSSFEPVDLELCNSALIVWTGPPGKYVVLTWTPTTQGQMLVNIGTPPTPPPPIPPPDPPPPTPPPPDPPGPDVKVPNEYGIGKVAYTEALKVGKPAEAAELAAAAKNALSKLVTGATTPAGAEAIVRTKREQLSAAWGSWEQAVEAALAKAIAANGSGALIYRSYMLEITEGLLAAAEKGAKNGR